MIQSREVIYVFPCLFFIVHYSFIILIWKKDLVVTLQNAYWAQVAGPRNQNMIQNLDTVTDTPGHDQETVHCHETTSRGGILKHTAGSLLLLTSQGAHPTLVWRVACFVMTTCGNSSPATRTPVGYLFCIILYRYTFFKKVNATCKYSVLIPIF